MSDTKNIIVHRMHVINARLDLVKNRHGKRLQAIVDGCTDRSPDESFLLLYDLIDDVAEATKGQTACARGCSHCCHIPVHVTSIEAGVMARRLGIQAEALQEGVDYPEVPYGYSRPCTFLKAGECSIYEHRPTPCRLQYNMAPTSEPCELTEEHRGGKVPYLNLFTFTQAAAELSIRHAVESFYVGELRDFFPSGGRP
jgi:Fe-S-cluster containining protein